MPLPLLPALLLLAAAPAPGAGAVTPVRLTTEYQAAPVGLDTRAPRLGWWLAASGRMHAQSAYRIVVASSAARLGDGNYDLWDSGRVATTAHANMEYAGRPPRSDSDCFWKVRAWDERGRPSRWSRAARWEQGLMAPTDWHGAWIAATDRLCIVGPHGAPTDTSGAANGAVLLRRDFVARKPIRRAYAYLCGLGYSELYLNGSKVGGHVLDPGFTDYTRRALYVTYDVTRLLRRGRNGCGIMLGGGWFNQPVPDLFGFEKAPWAASPRARMDLDIEYTDGTRQRVATGPGWRWSAGDVTFDSVRGGETIDHRLSQPGWASAGAAARVWSPAVVVAAPRGRLVSQQSPPIRVTESIRPVAMTEPHPGVFVFDLGVNIAGWARLRTRGPRGARIKLLYNEALRPDGTPDMQHTSSHTYGRFQQDEFILGGAGEETFEPRFTYHGFRYVEVTGLTERPTLDTVTGRWVTTDPGPAGSFDCSDTRIDLLQRVMVRTLLNNMHSIPTDCPQREKMGWMCDGCDGMELAFLNRDTPLFYEKWVRDMLDSRQANGHVPDIVPTDGWGKGGADGSPGAMADPWWGGTLVLAPWKLYQYYGDRRILAEAWPGMRAYVDYLGSTARGGLVGWGLGDWLDESAGGAARRVPVVQTSTAAYAVFAQITGDAAALLGRRTDADWYHRLARSVTARYNARFLGADGLYAADSQTAEALPLWFGLVPANRRTTVAAQLAAAIDGRGGHISAGLVGTLFVFHELAAEGRSDLAWRMIAQDTFPGWLYMIDHGATSLWEDWKGENSLNHPALGCAGFWFYSGLAGIQPDPSGPGFRRFAIRPYAPPGMAWVRCTYPSVAGPIVSNWRHANGRFSLDVEVPPGSTAEVRVPAAAPRTLTESGRRPSPARGTRLLRIEPGAVVYEVASGRYRFASRLP